LKEVLTDFRIENKGEDRARQPLPPTYVKAPVDEKMQRWLFGVPDSRNYLQHM